MAITSRMFIRELNVSAVEYVLLRRVGKIHMILAIRASCFARSSFMRARNNFNDYGGTLCLMAYQWCEILTIQI